MGFLFKRKQEPKKEAQILKKGNYNSDSVALDYHSSLTIEEAESLIGKIILKVEAKKNIVSLLFTDGSRFDIQGLGFDSAQGKIEALDTRLINKIHKI